MKVRIILYYSNTYKIIKRLTSKNKVSDLYSENIWFESRQDIYCSDTGSSWLFTATPGILLDSVRNYATNASFYIILNSMFSNKLTIRTTRWYIDFVFRNYKTINIGQNKIRQQF
jgi:hypothetical protein